MLRRLIPCIVFACCAPLGAQPYPSQPVKVVVPFGAGAATDLFARIVSQHLQTLLGQSVVVDNKPGGNGAIAAEYVARARPDGYTLMFSTASAHASNVWLMKQLRYDPVKDFDPVTRLGTVNFFIAVPGDAPHRSLSELVSAARTQPGRLSIATANATGTVASHAFARWSGADIVIVPYKSSPQAITDVMGGRISSMIGDFTSGASWLRSGRMRALALTGAKRSSLYPEIPTLDELGMKGFDLIGWFGLYAPAGTPRAAVALLNAKVAEVLANPELRPQFADLGLDVFSSTPEALGAHTRAEIRNWERYVRDAGLEAQ